MLKSTLSSARLHVPSRGYTRQSAIQTTPAAAQRVQLRAPRGNSVITHASSAEDPFANKYPSWDSIYKQLTEKYNLRSLTPDEAAIMIDEGKAILLDIRLEEDYAESHPKGSVSVPAFRVIKADDGGGIQSMLKMLVMKANGVRPTGAHPDFIAMAAAAAGSEKIVILTCEAGGTPFATPNFPTGKASRSLKACWKLIYSNTFPADRVMHLSGGVLAWYREGLPMDGESEYDTAKAGRTNNVVADVKK
jgi:rhodanese-related sulfurtransferase